MIFTVGNLITLVIVLILFAIYHKLTLDNRSLEKVKRMAERLQGDMGAYAEQKNEDLKNYGIQLDVQQQAAKVALEKLTATVNAVEEKGESIHAIEAQLDTYGEAIKQLMDMTARVDENLLKVQEEGAFADSVQRRLDTAKKSLDALERELPLLREDFAAEAAKEVQSFKDGILTELRSALEDTERRLVQARDEAVAAQEKAEITQKNIDGQCDAALEKARDRAVNLEDAAFTKLQEDSDLKTASLRDAIESRFAAVDSQARTIAGEIQASITAFRAQWAQEAKAMLVDARNDVAVIEDKIKTAQASAAETGKTADQSLEQARTELSALSRAIEERGSTLRDSIDAEKAAITAIGAELDELKAKAYTAVSTKLTEFDEALFSSLNKRKTDILSHLDSWANDLEARVEAVTSDAVARRSAAEDEHVSRVQAAVRDTTARLAAEADSLVDREKQALQARVDQLAAELAVQEEDLRAAIDAVRDETGTLRKASSAAAAQALSDADKAFQSELAAFAESSKTLVERARNEYETQRDAFERASQADRDRLRDELAALRNTMASLKK